jgi:hypothetical protein
VLAVGVIPWCCFGVKVPGFSGRLVGRRNLVGFGSTVDAEGGDVDTAAVSTETATICCCCLYFSIVANLLFSDLTIISDFDMKFSKLKYLGSDVTASEPEMNLQKKVIFQNELCGARDHKQ